MQNSYLKILALLIIVSAFHFSCKREFEKPRWDTQILAPLVKSKLTIKNIVKDSSKVQTESDNSVTLVNRQKIYDYSIDSLVSLNAPQYKKTVKLGSLVLANQEVTQRISLGKIATQMMEDNDPMGAQIIIAGQLGIPLVFPGVNNLTAGPFNIDITKFFKTADLITGEMTVKVTNQLPLKISNIQFSLNNLTPAYLITSSAFTNIAPGASQSTTTDLSMKTVGGHVSATIDDLDVAEGTILVDTSSALLVTISIKNVTVSQATAVFPEQEVVNETSNVEFVGLDNVRLTEARIRSGVIRADVYSTAQDTVRFTYEIPAATNGSGIFKFEAVVPPAPPNGTSYAQFNSDFSGYLMNLTGQNGDKYNTFYNVLKGKIRYTGRLVTLSLKDSLDITLTLMDAKPSYVKGYLGQDTIAVGPAVSDIEIFKNISANTLQFKSSSLSLVFENSLGMPAKANLSQLTAINTATNTSIDLSGTPINKNFPIGAAVEGAGPTVSTIDLSTGSNASSLLSILPNKISYAGMFDTNPQVSIPPHDTTHNNFAYSGADLKIYLDMKFPLTFVASNLSLTDTVDCNMGALNAGGFQNGKFNIFATNGFPIELKVDMRFLDHNGLQMDSIISSTPIAAAPIDAVTGKVTGTKISSIPFVMSAARLDALIHNGAKVVFTARFDTKPANKNITLYSDYAIELKLVGDIGYQVNSGQ